MSSITILSSSLAGKNECELCGKNFIHRKDLLRYQHTIHGDKKFMCYHCPYKTASKDQLVSHHKTHTKSFSDHAFNRKREASEAEAQLSPKKINVSKESLQPSNLKQKITHQEPPSSHKL